VEESLALPDVLADAGAAVGALVCGAPLAAAGAVWAIAGAPKLAASKIAAIDPGVAVTLFTHVLLSAQNTRQKQRTPLASALVSCYCNWLAKWLFLENKFSKLFI
jgi:hypothetical protein